MSEMMKSMPSMRYVGMKKARQSEISIIHDITHNSDSTP